ncbi:MAG: hypothetical protein V1833_04830 [Elusimicrobiota bacterium]
MREYYINKWVASRIYGGRTVIYNLKDHNILTLAGTSSVIWQEINKHNSLPNLTEKLGKVFNAPFQ